MRCSANVKHAYAEPGAFTIVVSGASRTVLRAVMRVSAASPIAGTDAAPRTATSVPADTSWQDQMLARINDLRSAVGAPPLALCARLTRTAQDYATLMASTGHYGHVGPDGSEPWDRMSAHGYHWSKAAENIAAGYDGVDSVMTGWRNSPGHYANIIDASLEHVGFGTATNTSSQYGTYWVQNFGQGGTCS